MELKGFHNEIINDHESLALEARNYRSLPKVRDVSTPEIVDNYKDIKLDVQEIIDLEIERIHNTPLLNNLVMNDENSD